MRAPSTVLLWLPVVALLAWGLVVTLVDTDAGGLQWVSVVFGSVLYGIVVLLGSVAVRLSRRRSRTP